MPDWYLDKPEEGPTDEFYLQAFFLLNTGRAAGFNVAPISWKDIIAYAEYVGLDREMTDAFLIIIRAMDTAYMDWVSKQPKKKPEK